MNKPYLILISGKKQSGKNTVGDYFVKSYDFIEHSFAGILKKKSASFLSELTGYTKEYTEYNFKFDEFKQKVIPYKYNSKSRTYREFLQYFGTEFYRNFFNDRLWAEYLCDIIINDYPIRKENIVITDWRFLNEYETVVEKLSDYYTIITLRINRVYTKNIFKRFMLWLKRDKHLSEISLDKYKNFDYIVTNDSDLKEVYFKIDKIRFDILRKGLEI